MRPSKPSAQFTSGALAPGVTFNRTSTYSLITVDLTTPGITFSSTGRASGWSDSVLETELQTTRDYITGLRTSGRNAVVAINGDLYGVVNRRYANLRGINVSGGQLISGSTSGGADGTFLFDSITGARIETTNGSNYPNLANVTTAISGTSVSLRDGVAPPSSTQLAARSLLGLSADNRYLYLFSITTSVTINQAATTLASLGADDAINLDGGGSTSMWWQYGGGLQGFGSRSVGSSLAIIANPL